MQLPRVVAVFNKYVTNRIQGLWAGRLPPWAMVRHVGRKSGKAYATPVVGFRTPEGFAIPMLYGPSTHWVKNIVAAGEGEIQRAGKQYKLVDPKVVAGAEIPADGLAGRYVRAGKTALVGTLIPRI